MAKGNSKYARIYNNNPHKIGSFNGIFFHCVILELDLQFLCEILAGEFTYTCMLWSNG